MQKAIINASPIISLCKIGLEDLLFQLFDEIYITDEVIREINVKQGHESYFVDKAIRESKLLRYSVKKKEMITNLYGKMHEGELSVIIGGLELGADYLILDEMAARNFAESLSLNPIGTIALLRIAKRKGLIKEVKPYLFRLREKGIWLSKSIIETVIRLENE
jgi:predicted nucleic acid-binding protein